MEEKELVRQLERLRQVLSRIFEEKGSFLDPTVLEISEEIDKLIVLFHRYRGRT